MVKVIDYPPFKPENLGTDAPPPIANRPPEVASRIIFGIGITLAKAGNLQSNSNTDNPEELNKQATI